MRPGSINIGTTLPEGGSGVSVITSIEQRLVPRDFEVMANWVKTGLFTRVKFIPNPEKEMEVNQFIYQRFVKACRKDLAGLKNLSVDLGTIYMELLWQEANKPKRRLVMEAMSTCRTTIYSAQGNRFDCKLLTLMRVRIAYFYSNKLGSPGPQ